jgi:hypothetical protein
MLVHQNLGVCVGGDVVLRDDIDVGVVPSSAPCVFSYTPSIFVL